jgi:hypothetical protein
MIPHHVYYQLVILVLLWLCLMMSHLWPSPTSGAPKTPTPPIKPQRRRSHEPKPFAGLTHKPHCALCEQETSETPPAPPQRPDPMPPTHRRPHTVDTSMHFCPHTDGQSAGQWSSQWWAVAAVPLPQLQRLFPRRGSPTRPSVALPWYAPSALEMSTRSSHPLRVPSPTVMGS